MRRVVVTGLGAVTALGQGVTHSWNSLIEGKSGISSIDHFDASLLSSKVCASVPTNTDHPSPFIIQDWLMPKNIKRLDNFIHFAAAAAKEAVDDSGIDYASFTEEQKNLFGVIIGSGIGGLPKIQDSAMLLTADRGIKKVSPFFISGSLINLASGFVSIEYGAKGPNSSIVTACSTGSHSIAAASDMIMLGRADIMITGGAEACLCPLGVAGFDIIRALSSSFNDNPTQASRPWDINRDGFVIGEGSGMLILEEYEHAVKRGAKIYAEIVGSGYSGDAYHVTAPTKNGEGALRAMENALRDAKITKEEVDYVNAHGTSTPLGDTAELCAVKNLFGDHMSKMSISSNKSSIGHSLGAAGAIEAVFSILSLKNNIAPPTLNLDSPDPETQGVNLVPLVSQEQNIDVVMSNNFGFGGTNISLIFKKLK